MLAYIFAIPELPFCNAFFSFSSSFCSSLDALADCLDSCFAVNLSEKSESVDGSEPHLADDLCHCLLYLLSRALIAEMAAIEVDSGEGPSTGPAFGRPPGRGEGVKVDEPSWRTQRDSRDEGQARASSNTDKKQRSKSVGRRELGAAAATTIERAAKDTSLLGTGKH